MPFNFFFCYENLTKAHVNAPGSSNTVVVVRGSTFYVCNRPTKRTVRFYFSCFAPGIVADDIQELSTLLSGNTEFVTAFCAGVCRHIARNDLFDSPNDIISSVGAVGAYPIVHVVKSR